MKFMAYNWNPDEKKSGPRRSTAAGRENLQSKAADPGRSSAAGRENLQSKSASVVCCCCCCCCRRHTGKPALPANNLILSLFKWNLNCFMGGRWSTKVSSWYKEGTVLHIMYLRLTRFPSLILVPTYILLSLVSSWVNKCNLLYYSCSMFTS